VPVEGQEAVPESDLPGAPFFAAFCVAKGGEASPQPSRDPTVPYALFPIPCFHPSRSIHRRNSAAGSAA
jgi:hypothetical protein